MIVIRNKEFSSKAQKARRDKFDIRVAKEMYGGTEGATDDPNQLKRVGRKKAKQGTIRELNDRLTYEIHGSGRDLSDNTKNAFLDALKGKRRAINEVEWRAMRFYANEPTDSKKFKSTDKLLDKLEAIKKKARLKQIGKIGLGVAGAAGLGYGIKKAIDKKKKDKK